MNPEARAALGGCLLAATWFVSTLIGAAAGVAGTWLAWTYAIQHMFHPGF
jgi:hypothetical protein